MNALLALLALALSVSIALIFSPDGPAAVVVCAALASATGLVISRYGAHARFLVHVFVAAVMFRVMVGSMIYYFNLQDFFGGDAYTYDYLGSTLLQFWKGNLSYGYYDAILGMRVYRNWGMPYMVGGIYALTGQNMLAVQFVNAVIGAALAP